MIKIYTSWLTILLVFGLKVTSTSAFFQDTSGHKYEKAIDFLEIQKVVSGYSDQTFKPEQSLNRAEFTKIVLEAFYPESTVRLEEYRTACFSDIVDINAWYTPYVCLAKEKKLVSGYPDNTFQATNEIQFVEAAKVIALTFNTNLSSNSDLWFRPYVAELLNQKVIPTSDIKAFNQTLTRGQMAEIVARGLKAQSQTLSGYLSYRETRYQESEFPNWEEFYGELNAPLTRLESDANVSASAPSEVTSTQEQNSPKTLDTAIKSQAIANTTHPGPYVDSNYITNYKQWTLTGYPASVNNDYLSDTEKEVLRAKLFRAFNEKRLAWEKPPVVFNDQLNQIAQEHAEHLVTNGIYSHTNIAGEDPFDRAKRVGYQGFVTESLTWRKKDIESALAWWEQSALHWNNLMNSQYNNIGIGIAGEAGDRLLFNIMTGE